MATFEVHSVEYRPGIDVLRISVRALDGPFAGQLHDLYATQAKLGAQWGDDQIVAEATTQLTATGAELVTADTAIDTKGAPTKSASP